MKNITGVIQILKLAAKYGSMIMILVEVIQFIISKMEETFPETVDVLPETKK